ncbi:TIGR02680 family protein [Allorhizocola rhizosphaerae]|uniref:TIGR02680 family protein n=1 Tax=Allorhizocola rhizosphaerae TaxID=1872709 RepID=UPI000E3DEAF0|nr:TIGR02680 family protein [Allorhizocola rhizosphaerae]
MRFTPTRAGIINLWDYRDEEFIFVDGWLVLRGPNGSGKTKALEVLFPFLLDGRIEPRRLNPFASEDRTMKSNVLYRGQEQSHAYVWMEFHRPATAEYVTIGIGLRAHKHIDKVTRHHFVTDGRVGVDFSLIDAGDRPLNRRDLTTALGTESVFDSQEEYRHAIDTRLFGLGSARYEQLLDLVLTLRKPQLAKDLNPVELSRTLQRGLRPLDDALIIEAAGSFDDMEAVSRTLEGLVAADQATASFLSVYSTYLRTHARAAADGLTARRAAVSRAADELALAHAAKDTAEAEYRAAESAMERAEGEPGRLRAHLERLKSSTAYQSHEQLADLKRHAADLARIATQATAAATREEHAALNRQTELETARRHSADASTQIARLLRALAGEAEESGIEWAAADSESEGFARRAKGRTAARRDDIRILRAKAAALEQAERDHAKAADAASKAAADTEAAEQAELRAEAGVEQSRDHVREAVFAWAATHADTLSEVGAVQARGTLAEAVGRIGAAGGPTLRELLTDLTSPGVTAIQQNVAALGAHEEALQTRKADLIAERGRIAAEHEDAPAAWPARTADRTGRPGAPLWRLVHFADDLADDKAAAVEAALEAAGLLDAWIHPDASLTATALSTTAADGYLHPLAAKLRPTGRTLGDLLVAEDQDHVPGDVIEAVLASIAVTETPAGVANERVSLSTTGHYAQGILLGRAGKPAPEYIGATARAARRAARIAECDRLIAELAAEITAVEEERARLGDTLEAVKSAGRDLPTVEPINDALRDLGLAANTLRLRREAQLEAATVLDQAVAEQAEAGKALRRAVAERSLPADRVDIVEDAVRRFESIAAQVEPARKAAARADAAATEAEARHDEASERAEAARHEAHEAAMRSEKKAEELQTLTAAVDDADVRRVLAEVSDTEQRVTEAEAKLTETRKALHAAYGERAAVAVRVDAAGRTLEHTRTEALREATRLKPFAHADLLSILRCPTDLRWPAHSLDDPAAPLPAEVIDLHEAILNATKELTPSENSLKQSSTRLNGALTELQAQLPAAGLDHRPEWETDDGVIVVRVADEQGLTPVVHFAERIARERADQEQLLSDAERRILEDALLTQLARQIHQRTVESRDLVKGMDAQMRARRMSSGLTIGVGWQLADDLDTDQREVCTLLERDPARLTAAQLTLLRRHFANRIKAARAMSPDLPHRDLLAQVLDYRQWRTFKFTLHRPGGGVENLTKARHSQLSGGEQSVSLHLPLFAAANALFGSARPTAPRMLGLDEAFAGVDENGRRELMALATEFDLDLFMTGYDLWATQPQVRGAAHYDLSHSASEATVATVLLVWNGTQIEADFDGTLARAFGSPETRRAPQELSASEAGQPAPDALPLEAG